MTYFVMYLVVIRLAFWTPPPARASPALRSSTFSPSSCKIDLYYCSQRLQASLLGSMAIMLVEPWWVILGMTNY